MDLPRVRVHGLNLRPELNGREGVVVEEGTTAERFVVLLEGEDKPLALKADHLQPLTLPTGTRVRLMGLQSQIDLNGRDGTVESESEWTAELWIALQRAWMGLDPGIIAVDSMDRVAVRLDGAGPGEQVKSVRAVRLKLLPPPAGQAPTSTSAAVDAPMHAQEQQYANDREPLASGDAQEDDAALSQAQQLLSEGQNKILRGDVPGAVQLLEQARACGQRIKDAMDAKSVAGAALGSFGIAYDSLGQYERAIKHYTQALTISREVGDRRGEYNHLGNLGTAHHRLGQYVLAIKHHMQALAISRDISDRRGEGISLGNLGAAYDSLGQYVHAIKHYTQALTISRDFRDRQDRLGEGNHLQNLGTVYRKQGQYDLAIEHLTQALAISRDIRDRRGEGGRLGNLGIVYDSLGQYKDAIEHHEQALAISREVGDRQGEATNLGNLGSIYLQSLNNPASALKWIQQSRSAFDALWDALLTDERRVSFGDTFSHTGRLLQLAHARLNQPKAALEAAEHARSRAFELLLAQQRLAHGPVRLDSASSSAAAQTSDVLLQVAARQGVTIVVFSLVQASQLLAWVVRGGKPLTMTQLYIPAEERSLTQLVELTRRSIGAGKREAPEATARSAADKHALPPPAVDEKALEEALRDDDDDGALAADPIPLLLRRCHDLLIAPIGLIDGEPLLLVPERDLYALPFAALLDANGKHLIERHSLRVAPSVGTVIELEERRAARPMAARPTALVVGNPRFGEAEDGWAKQLPGALEEARRVKSLLVGKAEYDYEGAVTKLVGEDAGKEAVVEAMRRCDVVHLATHGKPDAVLLGGATRAEGELSMAEVQGLELRARLVVLSGCDSFRGKLTSDGVIGITRAFVAAGALTLVSSLWKVDDSATLELMGRFYKQLLKNGDASAAMQHAMVSMISRSFSVLQWAGFVVYGLASVVTAELAGTSTQGAAAAPGLSQPGQTRSDAEESSDEVQYKVTGPSSVGFDVTEFTLQVWAMLDGLVERFVKNLQGLRDGELLASDIDDLDKGVDQLEVHVMVMGCQVQPPTATMSWNHKKCSSSHRVLIPPEFSRASPFTCMVRINEKSALRDLFDCRFFIERKTASGELAELQLQISNLQVQNQHQAQEMQLLQHQAQQHEKQLQQHVDQLSGLPPGLRGDVFDKVKGATVRIGLLHRDECRLYGVGSGTIVDPIGPDLPMDQVLTCAHIFIDPRPRKPSLALLGKPMMPNPDFTKLYWSKSPGTTTFHVSNPHYPEDVDWRDADAPVLIMVGLYQGKDQPCKWTYWAELVTPLDALRELVENPHADDTTGVHVTNQLLDLAVLRICGSLDVSPPVFTNKAVPYTIEKKHSSILPKHLPLPSGLPLGKPDGLEEGKDRITPCGWGSPHGETFLTIPDPHSIMGISKGLLMSQVLLTDGMSGGPAVDHEGRIVGVNSMSSMPSLPVTANYKAYFRKVSGLTPEHKLQHS